MTRRHFSTTARLAIFNAASNLRPAHAACHKAKTAEDNPATAKAKRREAIHKGAKAPPRQKIASAGFAKKERAAKPAPIGLCEFARRIR